MSFLVSALLPGTLSCLVTEASQLVPLHLHSSSTHCSQTGPSKICRSCHCSAQNPDTVAPHFSLSKRQILSLPLLLLMLILAVM